MPRITPEERRKYYRENRLRILCYMKLYYQLNKEKIRETQKIYRRKNGYRKASWYKSPFYKICSCGKKVKKWENHETSLEHQKLIQGDNWDSKKEIKITFD